MKWDVDEATGALWVAPEAAKSLVGSMKDKTGISFTTNLCYVKDNDFKWCTLVEENEKIGKFLVERFKDKKFADKFVKEFLEWCECTTEKLNQIDEKDFSKLSDKELFEILVISNDFYIHQFDWGFIMEPMDFVMPHMIEPRLIKLGYSAAEIADMLAIADITFLNRENQDLIKIKGKLNEHEMLKKHAFNYRWIRSDHMGRVDIPLDYFEKRLKEAKFEDLQKLQNYKSKVEDRKQELVEKKPLDKETHELLKVAKIIAPLHDRRKELFLRSIYTIDTARGEVARRFGYTKKELEGFEVKDIVKLEKGEILDKKYANALNEAVFYCDTKKGIWQYYVGRQAKEFFEREVKFEFKDITEINGMCASVGKAKGKVVIIHGTKDIDKMQQGDILVSSMTKPEFVPAIEKASAIVTDEGGVTCHAAIVSRELGIPCIIGTKIASKYLKDGDIVEVDAEKGLVKVIK